MLQLAVPPDKINVVSSRQNSITLSSSLAGRRPAREPAREPDSELDSVIEFGQFHYVTLSSLRAGSRVGSRAGLRPALG